MKINHAILHIFDFVACENAFANEEMDLTNKVAKNYVARHASKALGNLDNKKGVFSPDSLFAPEIDAYFKGDRDFVTLSQQIAEYLVGELGHMEKTPSTDLLVVDFEDADGNPSPSDEDDQGADVLPEMNARYFGLFLLESKQAYVHEMQSGETGDMNTVMRHRAVLPNTSQKLQSYALIDLRTLDVRFVDKLRNIAGEDTWLIPDGLLQCSMEASTREAFSAVTEIVEAVASEYGENTAVALSKVKSYAQKAVAETETVDLEELASDVFEENHQVAQRFKEATRAAELPERMKMHPEEVRKVARNHRIVTDTGIEIKFPASYSDSPEYITFTSEADGTLSIELKNITHIENR